MKENELPTFDLTLQMLKNGKYDSKTEYTIKRHRGNVAGA